MAGSIPIKSDAMSTAHGNDDLFSVFACKSVSRSPIRYAPAKRPYTKASRFEFDSSTDADPSAISFNDGARLLQLARPGSSRVLRIKNRCVLDIANVAANCSSKVMGAPDNTPLDCRRGNQRGCEPPP